MRILLQTTSEQEAETGGKALSLADQWLKALVNDQMNKPK